MHLEFGSAGAVCLINDSTGLQNQRLHIVLKPSKSVGAKGDVQKICGFVHPPPVITHSLIKEFNKKLCLTQWSQILSEVAFHIVIFSPDVLHCLHYLP